MSVKRGALPTLTEVIEVKDEPLVPAALPPESMPIEPQAALRPESAAVLTAQVLESLRTRIDSLLEVRFKALSTELQQLVAQAVDEALARRRKP